MIERPDLSWDAGQFVAGAGKVQIVWADDHGRSMIPQRLGDVFSPFGAELQIDVILGAGVFSERVPVGRFVIEAVTDAQGRTLPFDGRMVTVGETFGLNLKDPLLRVTRDGFPFPTAAGSSSVWQEIQSVSGMPVIRNLPDQTLPAGTVHEGDSSDVLSKLFDLLEAWPQVDASGLLTARPKAWPAPVDQIGAVVSAPVSMDSSKTYNRVVVEGKAADNTPLYGYAEVTDGFLRVANTDGTPSPYGRSLYRQSGGFLDTQSAVNAAARTLLDRVSRLRGVTREIEERFNPLVELGDVRTFEDGAVRVAAIRHAGGVTTTTVEVPDAG
ncbi:hypothetical protein [Microbacterium sp. PM5]|uniref:hypothetical protein n=1 Tax=Microbacterium sp. PM5 TaxID=2014534 RepID=UPI0013AEF3EF|nr:hypothetical protein [Microbacterium sp. PM5]